MRHAWKGYVEYAWGHDELAPLSKAGKDTFGGLGATIADAMVRARGGKVSAHLPPRV